MPNYHDVLTALQEEIVLKIANVTPRSNPDKRFDYLPDWDGETPTGKIRGFYIEWEQPDQQTIGSASKTYQQNGTLVVGYPRAVKWHIARITDTDKLSRALSQSAGQSDITGVSFRLMSHDAQPTTEDLDDWIWVRYPLITMIWTTE